MKYAIYTRVSTTDQSTEYQEIRLATYADQQGFEYDTFIEVQSTRKTRPIKASLMDKCRKGEYAGVLVWKLDRFARSSTELILDVKELIDKGISFYSLTENLDFNTSAGRLHFQILSAFAEFERDLIRDRILEGLARSKKKPTGRPKGSKDKKPRRKIGYIMRQAREKQAIDQAAGIHKAIEEYL